MPISADAVFRIGAAHLTEGTPCQDYALAEPAAALPFALVSDGCSTSGRTDLGARLLVLAARQVLGRGTVDRCGLRDAILDHALESAARFVLAPGDLDATLGAVQALPGGGLRGLLFGDGFLAARTADGLEVTAVEWLGNLPGYPAYLRQPDRLEAFLAQSQGCRIRRWRLGHCLEDLGCEDRGPADGLLGLQVDWPPGTDVAAVMTDGAAQVSGLPWSGVIAELTAIRAARAGAFAARRLNRALGQWARQGHVPQDDLALAALAQA